MAGGNVQTVYVEGVGNVDSGLGASAFTGVAMCVPGFSPKSFKLIVNGS